MEAAFAALAVVAAAWSGSCAAAAAVRFGFAAPRLLDKCGQGNSPAFVGSSAGYSIAESPLWDCLVCWLSEVAGLLPMRLLRLQQQM